MIYFIRDTSHMEVNLYIENSMNTTYTVSYEEKRSFTKCKALQIKE